MATTHHRSRMSLLLTATALALVFMPFLFWYQTWFGRELSDGQVGRYLQDTAHARKIQHALSQVAGRIARGDLTARRWYPQVAALAQHGDPIIRSTCAWTMGQESGSDLFHQALLGLLKDSDPTVRRNAALALVRFHDSSGRPELADMLLPYSIRSPAGGILSIRSHAGQSVSSGALLARIRPPGGRDVEVRSPAPGRVDRLLLNDGASVTAGDRLFDLRPEEDQAWEALRGLYLVGQPQDLAEVEAYARGARPVPERVRQQAVLTAAAIRTRSEHSPNR